MDSTTNEIILFLGNFGVGTEGQHMKAFCDNMQSYKPHETVHLLQKSK